jgi:transglutaminase-like putative cysteine protease
MRSLAFSITRLPLPTRIKANNCIIAMPVFQIHHVTTYTYDRPVRDSANQIQIYAYPTAHQIVQKHDLNITNSPAVETFTDYWGNTVGWFTVNEPHQQLVIDSQMVVNVSAFSSQENPVLNSKLTDWDLLRGRIQTDIHLLDLSKPEKLKSEAAMQAMLKELRHARDTPAVFIQRCSEYIFEKFEYRKGITTVETTVDEILEHRSGVCQDFAHVLLEMLRASGIPARYVSGYICPNRDGLRGAGATHAWVEAHLPSVGWVGIDPTNNVWVSDQHVLLSVGSHFRDCSPVRGTFKGPANQTLSVYVSVGYEDGHIMEDNNNVNSEVSVFVAPPIPSDVAAQQQ